MARKKVAEIENSAKITTQSTDTAVSTPDTDVPTTDTDVPTTDTDVPTTDTDVPTPCIAVPTTTDTPRVRRSPLPSIEGDNRERVLYPARHMGRLLALQQVDGIDSTLSSRVLKGQFDDKHGVVDPLSDIHTDPLEFRDTLMRAGYEGKFTEQPKTTE